MHRHLRLTSALLVGCAVAFAGLATPQPGRSADNPISNVSYQTRGGAFELSVAATGPVTTKVSRYSVDAKSDTVDLVVDVSPASYSGQTKVIGFSRGQIQQVRVGQLSATPAIMRIVVESQGAPKYQLQNAGNHALALSVQTSQVAFTLPPQEAVAAARAAMNQKETVIASTGSAQTQDVTSEPVHPAPAAPKAQPKPAVQVASKSTVAKPQVVAVAKPAPAPVVKPAPAPVVVAQATPNPWLPGGKFYCKVPSRHSASAAAMASHEAAMPARAPMMAPPGPPAGMMDMSGRNVNLDVKNADILDVLKLLANESGNNIVATQNVKGTVTLSLHDVPLQTALDLIVRTNGLDYRKMGNIYVVGTSDDLNSEFGSAGQEATQTVAFPIKYANPPDLAKQLAGVIPASSFTIDPRTDTVIVSGTPDIIQSARNFLALSDVPAPQVVFEVKVLDVTHDGNLNVGTQWVGTSPFDLFENCLACPPGGITVPVTTESGNSIGPQPFTRNPLFIQGQINYLITHDDATILANPRVAALDNQQASLLVGETYPLVYYDPRSGQFQAQYIDIGVKIIITPVVNTDGYITTTMHVERSSIVGLVQQFPILDNRKADSILRVKDGDTIVLGGLLDDESTVSVSKVPLLGDIPILGAFFKNIQKTTTHQEVVFLITPHIIAGQ
ncbi:MAG TPA: secretin N-terminal domain-containing protein [Candidatus Acidoferrales bacterium]|nr:secretin N-terminal domain-containing protein [Candidatus Acidoferrales bacterium]